MRKRGQVGVEYMMIVGFVTLAIMSILVFAMFYSDQIKDRIRLNQIESFAIQLLNSAETVFFAGEPSKTSVSLYLPAGVDVIIVESGPPSYLYMEIRTSSGVNKRVFPSKVPLSGSITTTQGIKKLSLTAQADSLFISL